MPGSARQFAEPKRAGYQGAARTRVVLRNLVLALALMTHAATAAAATVHETVTDRSGKPLADAVIAFAPTVTHSTGAAAGRLQASIDHINREFRPHVLVVQTGTLVSFPNSDNIRHQVYSFSSAKRFEIKLYAGKTAPAVLFDKPGVVVLGCSIHDTMQAYIYVVDTPYFATTDRAGRALLSVPIGHYKVTLWHPLSGSDRAPMESETEVTSAEQSLQQMIDVEVSPAAPLPVASEH